MRKRAMMCGWKAANSIAIALRDGKINRDGVKDYIEWWQRSYPDFFDYRKFLMLLLFYSGFFTAPELNYLFGFFKQPLRSTLNPFLIASLIKKAAQPLMPQILEEMPSLAEKLSMLEIENINADSLKKIIPELESTDKIDAYNKFALAFLNRYG